MPYKYFTRILLTIACIFSLSVAFSQADEVLVYGTVKNERSGKKMEGVQVALIQDGKQINTFSTPINGRFEFFMQYDHSYDIKFIKDGYVTKFITIDTRNVPIDDKVGGQGFDLDMSLFEVVEGVNFDILKQPIGIAKYSPTAHGIAFDYDYTKSIQDKIAKLKRDLEEKYKEEEDKLREEQLAAKKEQEKKEKFDKLVKEGDDQMGVGAYANAVFKYSDALDLMPDVKYVQDKLANAKKALEEEKATKALEAKYNDALAAADKEFNAKNYKAAVAGYNEALKLKPEEGYPKEKIKESEVILAQLAKQEAIDTQYKELITKADADYKAEKYDDALIAYNQASELKTSEQYPKDQIAAVNKKLDELKAKKELDANYASALKAADEAYKNSQYAEAIKKYEEASKLKSNEPYPKSQIAEAQKKISEQEKLAQIQKDYEAAIAEGDKAFKSEKWQDAITAFNKAKGLKPQETYPEQQIAAAQGKLDDLAAQQAKDKNYNTLIAGADGLFKAEKWQEAIAQYEAAGKVKPNEQYPKNQITAANAKLDEIAKQKSLDEQYSKLISEADAALSAKEYQKAITTYQSASDVKPKEAYPKDKIKEAQAKLDEQAKQKALDDDYSKAIAAADANFNGSKWQDAITGYEAALKLKSREKYPQDQIAAAKAKLEDIAKQKALDQQYTDKISEADAAFGKEKWQDAITAYQAASGLKPNEQYPKDKVTEAQGKLNALAEQKELDANYNKAIAAADANFKAEKWQDAINGYTTASGLKPNEQYPKDKIAEANGKLAEIAAAKEKEEQYNDLVAQADAAFKGSDWQKSIGLYNQALQIKAKEKYPQDQIKLANDKIAADKAAADLQAKYDGLIKMGDEAFNSNNFEASISAYNKALEAKPGEKYPTDRIAEAQKKIAELDKAAALQKQYDDAIADADAAFGKEKWQDALTAYNKASTLKPAETYPKDKIKEAQAKLDALAEQKTLNANYDKAIAAADANFKAEKWQDAVTGYTEASKLKPGETYPKTQIDAANKKLAEIAAAKEKEGQYNDLVAQADVAFKGANWKQSIDLYNQALAIKAKEKYPTDQIKLANEKIAAEEAEKQLDAKYQGLIKMGDAAFASADYEASISAYNKALEAKAGEKYPTDQIALARQKISELDKAAEIQKQYDDAIAAADANYDKQKWQEALAGYNQATGLKPEEAYPKSRAKDVQAKLDALAAEAEKNKAYNDKLTQADDLYEAEKWQEAIDTYLAAAKMKPAETYPKNQAEKAQAKLDAIAKQNQLAEQYKTAVAKGDAAFQGKKWSESIAAYNEALALRPKESYPKEQIDKANKEIEAAAKQAELNKEYTALITTADGQFNGKNYKEAIKTYETASKMKPAEQYPKDQIAAANKAISDLAEQAELDKQFQDLVAAGEKAFDGEKWQSAIDLFNQALAVRADAPYPKQKITEAQAKLDALAAAKAKEENYKNAIAAGDRSFDSQSWKSAVDKYKEALAIKPGEQYPTKRIAEAQAKLDALAKEKAAAEQYRDFIAQADEALSSGKYDAAIAAYNQALGVKPKDSYAEAQIKVANEYKAKEAAEKAKEDKYNGLVASGDSKLGNKQFDAAIADYQSALDIKPGEKYPTDQINKAKQALAAVAEQNKLNAQYQNIIKEADAFFDQAKYQESIGKYNTALTVKPGEAYPQKRIAEAQAKLDELERIRKEKQAEYDGYISKADLAFKSEAYTTAISYYKRATSVLPREKYPRDQIAAAEAKLSEIAQKEAEEEAKSLVNNTVVPTMTPEEEEAARRTETFTDVTTLGSIKKRPENQPVVEEEKEQKPKPKVDFLMTESDDVNKFRKELGEKYPEGLTEENHEVDNKQIYRIIYVENKLGDEYLKVTARFGTFYFKNGSILESSQYQAEVTKLKQ